MLALGAISLYLGRPQTRPCVYHGVSFQATVIHLPAVLSRPSFVRGLTIAGVGCILLFALVQCFRAIYSPDLGFHLRVGEWILDHGQVPRVECFSWLAAGRPFIDLYWLSQLLTALTVRTGGFPLLTIVKSCFIMGALGLVVVRTARIAPQGLTVLPLLLLPALITMSYSVRPHVISWVFLSVLLLLLEEYRRRQTLVMIIPLLVALWFNLHPLAALSWGALCAFVAGLAWERKMIDRKLVLITVLSAVAVFATPYAFQGLAIPLQQLGFLQEGSLFKHVVGEYASLFTFTEYSRLTVPWTLPSLLPSHLFILLAVTGLVAYLRRGDGVVLLLSVIFTAVLLAASKDFEYFVFAMSPYAACGLATLGRPATRKGRKGQERRGAAKPPSPPRVAILLPALAVLGGLACTMLSANDAWEVLFHSPGHRGFGLDSTALPVKCAEFLHQHQVRGKLLNDFSSGGYLMYALKEQVFMDGRNEVYGEHLLKKYLATYTPYGMQRTLATEHVEVAVFNYTKTPQWSSYFAGDSSWKLVYADEVNFVFLQRGMREDIPALAGTNPSEARFSTRAVDSLLQRPWPDGPEMLPSLFLRRQHLPMAETNEMVALAQMGLIDRALSAGIEGLERSTVFSPTLYLNLGNLFYRKKEWKRALLCYERFVATEQIPEITQRLRVLRSMPHL